MSAVLRGVPSICRSCLRLARVPRRLPLPLARPVRAQFLYGARRLQSTEATPAVEGGLTSAQADDALARENADPTIAADDALAHESADPPQTEPSPVPPPFRIAPSDIIVLKESLASGDILSAHQHFSRVISTPPESSSDAAASEEPLGHTALDAVLQPILGRMLEAIIADDGRNSSLPKPLQLLEQMGTIGALQTAHYATLLVAMLKNGANTAEMLAAFDSAVAFNSPSLREVMSEIDEFVSLDLDMATPYFVAFLVLRDKGMASGALSQLEAVLREHPYPAFRHVERVLDHHNFSVDMAARILSLMRGFSADTLFTNRHTLRQLIHAELAASATHGALEKLYDSMRAKAGRPLATHIYNTFISAFMGLAGARSSPRLAQAAAFRVWNDMIEDGTTPGVIEWTHLIKSFASQQDKSAILPLWKKMLKAGIIPDSHCWTVRIHAQLDANEVADGLESLRAMQASGLTPALETINAALDGLLKHRHFEPAAQVLAVADRLGIRKDIATYNTLLVSLMKEQKTNASKFDEALALIRQMAAAGIAPDVRTVTLVLDGMYKFSRPKPSLAAVLSLLDYCERAGIAVNTWTYTALIRALLEQGREDAAIDILLIMESRGMTGTRATYTILLKYYFRKRDLRSIDQLLQEMSQKRITMDGRTWREITVGFAVLGEVGRMKEAIAGMHKGAASMGLLGFMSLLKALGQRGLLMDVKEVVDDMLARGVVKGSREARVLGPEVEFWDVVKRLGNGVVLAELVKSGKVNE